MEMLLVVIVDGLTAARARLAGTTRARGLATGAGQVGTVRGWVQQIALLNCLTAELCCRLEHSLRIILVQILGKATTHSLTLPNPM